MKSSFTLLNALALTATLSGQSSASPISSLLALSRRQANAISDWAGILVEILKGANLAFPEGAQAWDYSSNPAMCAIAFSTENGGNCKAMVTCADGVTNHYDDWNVCYVGGQQFFTDSRIGDFSITFTQKDGTEGQGLTDPVLALAQVNNWAQFPVSPLARQLADAESCKAHNGVGCDNGPYVCGYGPTGNTYINDSQFKPYVCGMPKTGLNDPTTGLDSQGPVNEAGYAPGQCKVHVTQYQKPDPAVDSYSVDVTIYDANQDVIGATGGPWSSASPISLPSKLPYTVVVGTGAIDDDAVTFAYADQSWDSANSGDHACSVGAYDSGDRDMDCYFTC